MNPFLREANKRYRKSFLFCLTVILAMEVFQRKIWLDRLVQHGIICCVDILFLDLENRRLGHANSQQLVPNPQQVSKV